MWIFNCPPCRLQRLRQTDLHPRIADQILCLRRLLALLDLDRVEDESLRRSLLRCGIRIRSGAQVSAVADVASLLK